jgi:hypothetical protein
MVRLMKDSDNAKQSTIVCGEVGKGAIVVNRCLLCAIKKSLRFFTC